MKDWGSSSSSRRAARKWEHLPDWTRTTVSETRSQPLETVRHCLRS